MRPFSRERSSRAQPTLEIGAVGGSHFERQSADIYQVSIDQRFDA
jgi:hypothetical protein